MRIRYWVCAALLVLPGVAERAVADDEGKPLPVDRTRIIKGEGSVYTVSGRVRIPSGVEVTLQKGVILKRAGREAAVLQVAGSFVVHGITDTEVIIDGVLIEPQAEVKQLHLDMCELRGGANVATPKGKTTKGSITIENCEFRGARIDLAVTGGKIKVMSVDCQDVLRIRAVDPPGKKNRVYGSIRTSQLSGVEIENVADVTLRSNRIRSGPILLKDNKILVFDANKVEASEIKIEASTAKGLGKTKFTKNDLFCTEMTFYTPREGKGRKSLTLDKCWFNGITDLKEIAKLIHDGEDDEKNGVRTIVKKPAKRPHRLAASWSD